MRDPRRGTIYRPLYLASLGRGGFDENLQAVERSIGPSGIIAGHCGVPLTARPPRGPWINAGVHR